MTVIYDFLGEKTERTAFHHKKNSQHHCPQIQEFYGEQITFRVIQCCPCGT